MRIDNSKVFHVIVQHQAQMRWTEPNYKTLTNVCSDIMVSVQMRNPSAVYTFVTLAGKWLEPRSLVEDLEDGAVYVIMEVPLTPEALAEVNRQMAEEEARLTEGIQQ